MGWDVDPAPESDPEGTGFDSGSDRDHFQTFSGFSLEKWFSENGRKKHKFGEKNGHNSASTKTDNLRLKSFILTRRGGAI